MAERLVTLEDQYKFLTNLEQELMDIRKKGNIIAYEKGGKGENTTGNSLDTRKSQRKELGSHTDGPSTIHMAVQPMQYNKIVTKQRTRDNSNPDHVNTSHPEQFIQASQKEDTSNRGARQKNKMLGEVAWEQMLNDNKSELPNTKFMGHLKKAITCEQFQQLNDDILRGMNISRKEFCNTDHHTLQEATCSPLSYYDE